MCGVLSFWLGVLSSSFLRLLSGSTVSCVTGSWQLFTWRRAKQCMPRTSQAGSMARERKQQLTRLHFSHVVVLSVEFEKWLSEGKEREEPSRVSLFILSSSIFMVLYDRVLLSWVYRQSGDAIQKFCSERQKRRPPLL